MAKLKPNTEKMVFSTEVITVPIEVEGHPYTLTEATGADSVAYRNAVLACTKLGPSGKPSSIAGMGDLEPLLVSLCLTDDSNKQLVSKKKVMSWPARIQKALFDRAQEISDLGEVAPERMLLEKALELPGAPITFSVLRSYIADLEGDKWNLIQVWIEEEPTDEELAKNGQASSTAG